MIAVEWLLDVLKVFGTLAPIAIIWVAHRELRKRNEQIEKNWQPTQTTQPNEGD